MTERRFNEEEVAEIFRRATEATQRTQRQLPSGEGSEGMTLAELREIGREVGVSSELIDQAAKSIDLIGRPTSRRFFGLPISVGRTVELNRKLTDEEWDRLVVDLRETFDARGSQKQEGSFRQWTNGNLQALLEPTATGHRLRLRTFRAQSRALMGGGLAFMGVAVVALVSRLMSGDAAAMSSFIPILLMGAGMFGVGALQLPGWARLRQRQMEEVAARLTSSE